MYPPAKFSKCQVGRQGAWTGDWIHVDDRLRMVGRFTIAINSRRIYEEIIFFSHLNFLASAVIYLLGLFISILLLSV